jgi:hypothetical protein
MKFPSIPENMPNLNQPDLRSALLLICRSLLAGDSARGLAAGDLNRLQASSYIRNHRKISLSLLMNPEILVL